MAHGILVPLDGSSLAAQALPYARLLAQSCHAEIILAQAGGMDPQVDATSMPAHDDSTNQGKQWLAAMRDQLRGQEILTKVAIEQGAPAGCILEMAGEYDAALLLMTTHGQTGPSRWVMGHVAEQVLRRARLPILLLTPRALEAGAPDRLLRRVVVPVDGSELSREIYPVVKALAQQLHDPITLVRAVDNAILQGGQALNPSRTPVPEELVRRIHARLAQGLQQRAVEWRAEDLDVEVAVERGPAPDVIAQVVEVSRAGWIAMASHGRSGLGGLVLGSTALAVLRQVAVPVLLAAVPRPDRYQLGDAA